MNRREFFTLLGAVGMVQALPAAEIEPSAVVLPPKEHDLGQRVWVPSITFVAMDTGLVELLNDDQRVWCGYVPVAGVAGYADLFHGFMPLTLDPGHLRLRSKSCCMAILRAIDPPTPTNMNEVIQGMLQRQRLIHLYSGGSDV